LAVGDVPVGRRACFECRVDRAGGLGQVPDPVDLRLQELARRRSRGAPVWCVSHARGHGLHAAGGSGTLV
jgi:hypothetical protein